RNIRQPVLSSPVCLQHSRARRVLHSFPTRRSSDLQQHVLESLRQPLEDGRVTIARASGVGDFPARFQLVAAANPCRRGCKGWRRSEEHTSELQSRFDLVCRLLLEKKNIQRNENVVN